jgi:carotenoid 1,2-hydratase
LPPAPAAPDPWALLQKGQEDRLIRAPGSRDSDAHPRFDAPVPPGGYSWWYVDALSDDGQHGLTVIAFIGSVSRPVQAVGTWKSARSLRAQRRALWPRARWTMTERPEHAIETEADRGW